MGTPIGTVAILAALPQELAAIHDSFQLDAAADLRPLEGHRFVHRGLEVVAVRVGVGKVNAAMATQRVRTIPVCVACRRSPGTPARGLARRVRRLT